MSNRANPQGGPLWVGLVLLTVANALLYAVAAILHWGAHIVLGPVTLAFPEPIQAASIVEGAIALILAAAAIGLLAGARPDRRSIWFAYVAALIGTLFGLTIALLRNLSPPDIWVHIVMLAGLASGFVMLLAIRRALLAANTSYLAPNVEVGRRTEGGSAFDGLTRPRARTRTKR